MKTQTKIGIILLLVAIVVAGIMLFPQSTGLHYNEATKTYSQFIALAETGDTEEESWRLIDNYCENQLDCYAHIEITPATRTLTTDINYWEFRDAYTFKDTDCIERYEIRKNYTKVTPSPGREPRQRINTFIVK